MVDLTAVGCKVMTFLGELSCDPPHAPEGPDAMSAPWPIPIMLAFLAIVVGVSRTVDWLIRRWVRQRRNR